MISQEQVQVFRREFQSSYDRVDGPPLVDVRDAFSALQDTEAVLEELRYPTMVLPLLLVGHDAVYDLSYLLVPEPDTNHQASYLTF